MPKILSLETSSSVCSAALHENGKLLAVNEIHQDYSHGSKLAVLIDHLLAQTGLSADSLAAVAVTGGPGSYTGLRIGTSTAKGFAYAMNIPMVSVGTLDVMAWQVLQQYESEGLLCPMLDARRMEVYCKVFSKNINIPVSDLKAKVVDENSFQELLAQTQVLFFGPGAAKCRAVLRHENARFLNNIYPSASALGELAWKKFAANQFEDLVHFEPVYLKDFIAKKSEKSILN